MVTGPVRCRPRQTVDLEAWLVTEDNILQVAEWAGASAVNGPWNQSIGLMNASAHPGDYVMRGITGHFFVRSAAEYEREYEVIAQ